MLHQITAVGAGLREAALQMQRLGFTLCRGDHPRHLRILLEEGWLDLFEQGEQSWHWGDLSLQGKGEAVSSPPLIPGATSHANTALGLRGVMLLAGDRAPLVAEYARLAGRRAHEAFTDPVLGIEGEAIPLPDDQWITVASAPYGTGPAADFLAQRPPGLFAPILRVRSLQAAAAALRQGAVYSYHSGTRLITSQALPGHVTLIFEE